MLKTATETLKQELFSMIVVMERGASATISIIQKGIFDMSYLLHACLAKAINAYLCSPVIKNITVKTDYRKFD